MSDDTKLVIVLIISFVFAPMVALGISEWRNKDCRVELAKAGKTVEEIKEICK